VTRHEEVHFSGSFPGALPPHDGKGEVAKPERPTKSGCHLNEEAAAGNSA